LLVAVAAAWLVVGKKNDNGTKTGSNSVGSQSQAQVSTNSYAPTTVAYAFKGDDHSPYTLYTRPVGGGDRTAADQKLIASETINASDVNGSNITFTTNKAIYVSTDAGKTYKAIVTLSANEQITDLKFANDGHSIVYADLPSSGGKNTVKSIDLSGSNSKDLFTTDKSGVLITSYSSSGQKIIYSEGCWDCDGFSGLPLLRDLKTSKVTQLLTGLNGGNQKQLINFSVSRDFSKAVYSTATPSDNNGLGATVAPYGVGQIDIATNKSVELTSFGTKGEKNSNGTLKSREVHVGFVAGTNTPYYTSDGQLYEVKSGSPSLVYEAAKPILYIPFVGNSNVIAGSGDQTADYALTNYDFSSKKSTAIFSGDNNTVIFGVTTK